MSNTRLKKLINWTELSRHLSGGKSIRANSCPDKHREKVDSLLDVLDAWDKGNKAEPDLRKFKNLEAACIDFIESLKELKA